MEEYEKKTELVWDGEGKEPEVEDVVDMIEQMMAGGVSRLKVKTSDEIQAGELKKEYHHGRCDVGSPWACGRAFDVLE